MAPVGKFMKAVFLGLVSKSKWRRSKTGDKNTKRRQIFDVGDGGQDLFKRPNADKVDDDVLGLLGAIGTLGTVFWGQFPDGSQIAVKKLDPSRMKGVKEFSAAAMIIGNVRHKNLLSLRGFCAEGKERLIVYDYMVNLSVHTHLHGSLSSSLVLDWSRRMSVAIDAAEGLAHLHHRTSEAFIHGEIKSNNILLDANYEAKWADYSLMKLMQGQGFLDGGTTAVLGYLAPEYREGQGPSQSGDVFGFGILLLELISGKKPLQKVGSSPEKKSMWEWAEPLIAQGRYSELVDPRLHGHYRRDDLNLVVYVAIMCAQTTPSSRLTMIEAAELLKCVCGGNSDEIVLLP